ncbi:leucine-rich repeat-containing protein [Tanacetum coccineum]|uniref:Leucine-rich repeat-containing protein n=1 Tax=Tanacetum coccineum TaxID=301880 RepID=A0ABQ5GF59_9ASTR
MKKLESLDISNNDIHGHIPDWVGEIGGNRLLVLDLSNNSIAGTIPNVYDAFVAFEGLILNGNQLEGEIPTSLYKCHSLKVLDLGNNYLNGTFPSWLGNLPNLQAFILKSNNFHGYIFNSSDVEFPFPSLRVFDLSNNGFQGRLPENYFLNFNAMKKVVKKATKPEYLYIGGQYYSIMIVVKGADQEIPRLFVEYTIVDLSNNKFENEIPNIIGNLRSLKVLDLSHNKLNGRIPKSFGKLSEIESLDLSCNQLTGEIPPSLVALTFLSFLNISQNHLMGRIPQGKQFNTFEGNSFGGNPELCGLPLLKECDQYRRKPQVEGVDEDKEKSGLTWKPVILGYSCGTLLGLVLGYLMLSTGRPKWFNALADAAEHRILKRQT